MYKLYKESITDAPRDKEVIEEIAKVQSNETPNLDSGTVHHPNGSIPSADELPVDENIKLQWEKEQAAYKTKLNIEDVEEWTRLWSKDGDRQGLKYIGKHNTSGIQIASVCYADSVCVLIVTLFIATFYEIYFSCIAETVTLYFIQLNSLI